MIDAGRERENPLEAGHGCNEVVVDDMGERDENIGLAYGMGLTAEKVAQQWKVSSDAQDAFALESHRRALAAQQAGEFKDEITPVTISPIETDILLTLLREDPRLGAAFLWSAAQEEAVLRGVAADAAGQSQGSMGVAVADLDGNLLPDLVVTNLDGESNSVCLNQAGSFQELSSAWQMDSSSWPFTGFGTALADLNHDGYTDFVAVHGRVRRQTASPESPTADTFWDGYREQQLLLLGHNDHFEKPDGVDEFSSLVAVARGLASGDVDNDGQQRSATQESARNLNLLQSVSVCPFPARKIARLLRDPLSSSHDKPAQNQIPPVPSADRKYPSPAAEQSAGSLTFPTRTHDPSNAEQGPLASPTAEQNPSTWQTTAADHFCADNVAVLQTPPAYPAQYCHRGHSETGFGENHAPMPYQWIR